MSIFAYMFVDAPLACLVPMGGQKGMLDLRLELQIVVSYNCVFWELKPCPLGGQSVFLAEVSSL